MYDNNNASLGEWKKEKNGWDEHDLNIQSYEN